MIRKQLMTRHIIIFLFITFATHYTIAQTAGIGPANNTIITGTMAEDLMKEIQIIVDRTYIDNSKKTYNSKIENDSFKFEFFLDVPQTITLKYLRNTAEIYIEPGDHLHIDGNANSFYFSFQFSGNSAANNDFLRVFGQKYRLHHPSVRYFRYKKGIVWYRVHRDMDTEMRMKGPDEYKTYMDSLKTVMMEMVESYDKKEALSEDFNQYLWAEINYYWGYHLLTYGYAFGYFHNIDFQEFFGFMYQVPLQNERALGSQYYRDYIRGAVNYYCEGPKKIPSPDDKIEEQLLKQFNYAAKELEGKGEAYVLSEIIREAFREQVIGKMMDTYDNFLKENPHKEFNDKVQ